jgi:hypothetical protein
MMNQWAMTNSQGIETTVDWSEKMVYLYWQWMSNHKNPT